MKMEPPDCERLRQSGKAIAILSENSVMIRLSRLTTQIFLWTIPGLIFPIAGSGAEFDQWNHIRIEKEKSRSVGLAAGDCTGDEFMEIATDQFVYINPGNRPPYTWKRSHLGGSVEAMLITHVDSDALGDIIGFMNNDPCWFKAKDTALSGWERFPFGYGEGNFHAGLPSCGAAAGQIVKGGKNEIVLFIAGFGLAYFSIPENPAQVPWQRTLISSEVQGQGVACGDFDSDGDLDVAACGGPSGWSDAKKACWWENPGSASGPWKRYEVFATGAGYLSQFDAADINGDGKTDIVTSDGEGGGGDVFWLEQPRNAKSGQWTAHRVGTGLDVPQGLDVADMDNDNDIDIIAGETVGKKRTVIYENRNDGLDWVEHVAFTGAESQYGTKTADLDRDGDFDVISIGWFDTKTVHVLINKSLSSTAAAALFSVFAPGSSLRACLDRWTGLYTLQGRKISGIPVRYLPGSVNFSGTGVLITRN
jgi:hypothetical protein